MKVNERRTVVRGVDLPLCPPNRGERSTRMTNHPPSVHPGYVNERSARHSHGLRYGHGSDLVILG